MSTIGDVIHDSAELVQAFDELLKTETVRQMPQIARDLGVKPQFDAAIGKAGSVVSAAAVWTGAAWEVATGADAATALFGLLPGIARDVGRAIEDAGTQARELELDFGGLQGMANQMNGAVKDVAAALDVVVGTAEAALAFIDPPKLRTLQLAFNRVGKDLAALSAPPAKDMPDTVTSSGRTALIA